MTHDTDERRARALFSKMESIEPDNLDWRWECLEKDQRAYIDLARAIRASDEAAGMVLVPRADLKRIAEGRTCVMLTSLPPDCQRAHWARAMIAATEAEAS